MIKQNPVFLKDYRVLFYADCQLLSFTMDTKLKGDIAEQAAVLYALKRGWGVLKPFGDRLPYDLAFDVEGTLIKIQLKPIGG